MPKPRQLLTADQAITVKTQHRSPCSDCPFARKSLAGWLGRLSPQAWMQIIFGDGRVDCHTRVPMQCAGSAIFRANICKVPRDQTVLQDLKVDTIRVFATPEEFISHHGKSRSQSWSDGTLPPKAEGK